MRQTRIRTFTVNEKEASGESRVYFQISACNTVVKVWSGWTVRNDECGPHFIGRGEKADGIARSLARLRRIVTRLEQEGGDRWNPNDAVVEFEYLCRYYTVRHFATYIAEQKRMAGRVRTAETYMSALNSFMRFRNGVDMPLDELTATVARKYEQYLRDHGVADNTVSFYMRVLRAIYNRAVESGEVEQTLPFKRVYTGIAKTVKRALPLATVKKIRMLDLGKDPALDFARDMFMLSFYLRGMSMIDMAFLTKTDLRNGYVNYRRRKTGQPLTVAWTPEMEAILSKYPENPTRYLFPIIKTAVSNERCCYRNVAYNINRSLKRIGCMVGVGRILTMYCARHSWATAARSSGIPLSIISEGMGHGSEKTTRIYLASLDTSVVDRANETVIRALD